MASQLNSKPYQSHAERTAEQPRDPSLHSVSISSITQTANNTIRLLRLRIQDEQHGIKVSGACNSRIKFLPGQWLDLHVPSLAKPGGFTVTSPPVVALPLSAQDPPQREKYSSLFTATNSEATEDKELPGYPFVDLAVQFSPKNPPAAWLWQSKSSVLGQQVQIRVGGEFTWPPKREQDGLVPLPEKVVFVAGGVGINPLMAMVAHMYLQRNGWPSRGVRMLYGHKVMAQNERESRELPEQILFFKQLTRIFETVGEASRLEVFLTPSRTLENEPLKNVPPVRGKNYGICERRIALVDVEEALGKDIEIRKNSVVYICGPQAMTDEFVERISSLNGMRKDRVLCEKWW